MSPACEDDDIIYIKQIVNLNNHFLFLLVVYMFDTYAWVNKRDPNLYKEWDFKVNLCSHISASLFTACFTNIQRGDILFLLSYPIFIGMCILKMHYISRVTCIFDFLILSPKQAVEFGKKFINI